MTWRKIRALTGVRWESTGGTGYLTSTYRILYGGIDSDAVVARLGQPNAVMAAVMKRMANEVACKATAFDFTKAKDKRLLFPAVDVDTEPEGADAEAAIKANIKHLHARLLGEQLADDSAELAATYKLFVETYKEGLGALGGACYAIAALLLALTPEQA